MRAVLALGCLSALASCTVLTDAFDYEVHAKRDGGPRDASSTDGPAADADADGSRADADGDGCAAVDFGFDCSRNGTRSCSGGVATPVGDYHPWPECDMDEGSTFTLMDTAVGCVGVFSVVDPLTGSGSERTLLASDPLRAGRAFGFSFSLDSSFSTTLPIRIFQVEGVGIRVHSDSTLCIMTEDGTGMPVAGAFPLVADAWYDVIVEVDAAGGTLYARDGGSAAPFEEVGVVPHGDRSPAVTWGIIRGGGQDGLQIVRLTGFVHGQTFDDVACAF